MKRAISKAIRNDQELEFRLKQQVARIVNLSDAEIAGKVTSIYLNHYRCLEDFTSWTGSSVCPKCGTPGELFKSSDRETRDTMELFSPILDQIDDLELAAQLRGGSIFASDPPRPGTDLRTALEEAVENYEAGITINEDLLTMLRELAAETGESVNSQVNKAVRDYVEMWSDPEPAPSLVVRS